VTDRLLTADDVAELLNMPVTWVRRATRENQVPHLKLGTYRRYRREDVLAWMESLEAGGGPSWRKYRPQLATGASE